MDLVRFYSGRYIERKEVVRLKQSRRRRKIWQADMADMLDIDVKVLKLFEQGRRLPQNEWKLICFGYQAIFELNDYKLEIYKLKGQPKSQNPDYQQRRPAKSVI